MYIHVQNLYTYTCTLHIQCTFNVHYICNVHVHVYVHTCTCIIIHVHVCTHACTHVYTHAHMQGTLHVHASVTLLIPQAGGHAADSGLTPSAGKTPRRTGSGSQTNELSARIDQLTAVLVIFSLHVHRGSPL